MQELVADDDLRATVVSEFPTIQRSFYDDHVDLASGWTTRPCCSLQLSPAYEDELNSAALWSWPNRRLDGRHLDLVDHPAMVAKHVTELVEQLHLPSA